MPNKKLTGDIPSGYIDKFNQVAKDTWKHDDFRRHVLKTIHDSSEIRDEIKEIVWQTVKDKIIWIIIGFIIFMAGVFFKDFIGGWASELGKSVSLKMVTEETTK